MNAKKTDLKELEGWYEKSGNQLMLLYGGTVSYTHLTLPTKLEV